MKKKLNFEAAMNRLDEIASLLANGKISLDESLVLFSESAQLIAQCEKELSAAKLKVQTLFPNNILEDGITDE